MSVIVLLTDFGTKDGFVGCMKGVILSINPQARIVDLTHEVEPFNILEASLILKAHYKYFPKGSIFVCVVDPGVGSERLPIVLKVDDYIFVGPYNGIFDLVVKEAKKDVEAHVIENRKLMLESINNTFHGRDIFAPVSAHISKGLEVSQIGRRIDYAPILKINDPERRDNFIEGEIIYFDRFGNAITNVPCGKYSYGEFRNKKIKVVPFFQAGDKNKLNLVCGSFGLMEIFTPMKNAREEFKLKKGERVRVFL